MPSLEWNGFREFGHLVFNSPASGCGFVSSRYKTTLKRMETFLKRTSSLSLKDRMALPVSREREGPCKAIPRHQSQAGSGMTFSQGLVPGAPEATTGSPAGSTDDLSVPLSPPPSSPLLPLFFLSSSLIPSPPICLLSCFLFLFSLSSSFPSSHLSSSTLSQSLHMCMWRSEGTCDVIPSLHSACLSHCLSQGLSLSWIFSQ